MRKLREVSTCPVLESDRLENIMDTLFLIRPQRTPKSHTETFDNIPLLSKDESSNVVNPFRGREALKAVKAIAYVNLQLYSSTCTIVVRAKEEMESAVIGADKQ